MDADRRKNLARSRAVHDQTMAQQDELLRGLDPNMIMAIMDAWSVKLADSSAGRMLLMLAWRGLAQHVEGVLDRRELEERFKGIDT